MLTPNAEIGRELTVPDLQVETVVVVTREDRPSAGVTMWVKGIGPEVSTIRVMRWQSVQSLTH